MIRLFVALSLDEDVDILIAQQERALLTPNRADFELLHQTVLMAGRHHHGIVIAVRRPAHEIAQRISRILDAVTADKMQDQLRYI